MVSLNSILTLGVLGGAALLYFKYGGLSGIGSALGSAVSGFGSGVTQGLNRFGNLVETPQSNAINPAQRVTEQLDLGDYVIPSQEQRDPMGSSSAFEKSGLTFAGLEQQFNTAARIDLTTGERKSSYGQAQRELSREYGIPTFDTAGNLSTFAGASWTVANNATSGGSSV